MSEWLELELADRLAPVRAPERLWYMVQSPRTNSVNPSLETARRRPVKSALLLAAVAAACMWVAAGWRPETRNVRTVVMVPNASMACQSCHTD